MNEMTSATVKERFYASNDCGTTKATTEKHRRTKKKGKSITITEITCEAFTVSSVSPALCQMMVIIFHLNCAIQVKVCHSPPKVL